MPCTAPSSVGSGDIPNTFYHEPCTGIIVSPHVKPPVLIEKFVFTHVFQQQPPLTASTLSLST